jgi:hypothetical protein
METMKAKTLGSAILCTTALLASLAGGLMAQAPTAESQPSQSDVAALKAQLAEQQKQIDQLKAALDEQRKLIERTAASGSATATSAAAAGKQPDEEFALPRNKALGDVASASPIIPPAPAAPAASAIPPLSGNAAQPANDQTSPLQLKVGDAYITPVGFMDFTTVWSDHARGSGIGTNFASIPYGNVYQNRLSELRESIQNSRIGFRVDANVLGAHVLGYMEADFLGNNPANVAVTSNSNTLRSRLYWVDLRKGGWEVLGGQTWSLITPGRTGISPLPGNVFYSQDMDVNYQAGLVWGRIPELRIVYHGNDDKWAFAFALDNQEQYIGGSGSTTATLPAALNSVYNGGELNNGGTTLGAPQFAPDLIAKLAFDPSSKFHAEIGGVLRSVRVWNPINNQHYSAAGGGGFINLNFVVAGGFRLITNNFWSDGGGRYIFGMVPDLTIRSDGSPSFIHTGSTVSGFEWTLGNTLIYSYYGGTYVGKDVIIDTTGKTPALVGYGYTGSPNGQNRAIQEATFGVIQTFWKNAKYGQLSLITQYSYLTRNPWYVPNNGSPSDAHLSMIFVDLRYTLPGSAPTLGKP